MSLSLPCIARARWFLVLGSLAACGAPEFHSAWLDQEPSEGVFRGSRGTQWLEFRPSAPTFARTKRLLSVCGRNEGSSAVDDEVSLCAHVRLDDSILGDGPMTLLIEGQGVQLPEEGAELQFTAGKDHASGVEAAWADSFCMWGGPAGTSAVLRGRLQLEQNSDTRLAGRLVLMMEGRMGPCVSDQAELNLPFDVAR